MKKLLSLLTLLIVAIGTSWAVKPTITGITASNIPDAPTTALDLSSQEEFEADVNGWIVFYTKGVVDNKAWWGKTQTNGGSTSWTVPEGTTAPFKGGSSVNRFTMNTSRVHAVSFTGAESASFLGKATVSGGTYRNFLVNLYTFDGTSLSLVDSKTTGDQTEVTELLFEGLTASTTYVAYAYGDQSSNSDFYEVALKAPTGPVDPVFSVSKTSFGIDETAKILVDGKDIYGANFNNPTTLWETHTGGPYISLGVDGTITPLKKTPEGYGFHFYAGSKDAEKYNSVTSSTLYINITAPVVVTPTITAGGYFFDESKTVEIACTDADATIQYSYDNSTWNDYTTALTITETTTVYAKAVKTDCEDSEVASATYTKFAKSELASVSAAATWDFTKITSTLELKDDGTTTPAKNDDYYTLDDIATINGTTIPSGFGDATTIAFKGQYPYRSKKSQAGYWKFNTTVAGTIAVTFSDTGSSGDGVKRYLNINGTNTEYYTQRDGTTDKKTAEDIVVPAGDVIITAYGEDGETWQAIVVEKIVFTPATATTINLNAKGYATYSKATDFMFAGATGYKMTLDEDAATITGTAVTGKIAAGEGILFKGEANATVTILETTGATALADNSLSGTTTASGDKADVPSICYTLSGDTFKKFTGTSFNDNKAYIEGTKTLSSLTIVFEGEEATSVEAIAEAAEAVAPVKVIKNGKLYIGNYNVAGQQVK
ncbi:MAG: chitobiase/beta-hexosaminidase C-terminal domain-containing protein [Prevotella sp.]|nr:chitobiase/beta-hexosaminidase C-terminal domain-containing protein [Prevotella sp.]